MVILSTGKFFADPLRTLLDSRTPKFFSGTPKGSADPRLRTRVINDPEFLTRVLVLLCPLVRLMWLTLLLLLSRL